jgi:LysM repeat protein
LLTKLKQSAWALVATVALSTAAFSVLPNTAEAQDMPSVVEDAQVDNELLAPHSMAAEEPASAPATHATAVIVNPGDSLWSIVQERLHPEATPQQIALEVNQLYELNQDRIGGDPNLIFPGQEFLVPQAVPPAVPPAAVPPAVMAEPAAPAAQPQTGWGSPLSSEEPATAAAASPALSAEEPVPAEPAASEDLARSEGPATTPVEPSTPQQPVASEEPATPEQVTEPVNETVNEPAAPSNNAPTDEETASPLAGIVDPLIDFYDNHKGGERQLLGVGILVLTALVAILMAWRLPMKRSVDSPTAWGIPGGYYQEERPPAANGIEDHKPAPASGAPEPATRRGPSDPTATEESEPASDNGSESPPYPSLAARQRQERLRRIRQRTLRPTRRASEPSRSQGRGELHDE